MNLQEEQERIEALLKGKCVKEVFRHRPSEIVMVFSDGSSFIIDVDSGRFDFSITAPKDR